MVDPYKAFGLEAPKDILNTPVKHGPPKPLDISSSSFDMPDALVLLMQKYNCACGHSYSAPNGTLMYRFDKSYRRPDHWVGIYNSTKKETKTLEVSVPTCPECFKSKIFTEADISMQKKG